MDKTTTAGKNINTGGVVKAAGIAAVAGDLATALQDKDGNSLGLVSGDKIEVSYVIDGATKTDTVAVSVATRTF